MRLLTLNLLTCGATAVLLALLALPAMGVLGGPRAVPAADTRIAPAADPRRVFGAYVDPWHVDDWARAVGATPQAIAKFESFSRDRTLAGWARETRRRGIRRLFVSWEPWAPVPVAFGLDVQSRPQPGYRNIDIATGSQDRYITRFARSLAAFPGTVYLRYAHEMNGYWYPWSRGSTSYRWAWRRIVRLFRLAGARNVRFVWSVNPNLYDPAGVWMRNLRRYWPGRRYVDDVATTMINFGGTAKRYPVARFVPRLRALRARFRKPVILAETNTDLTGRVPWLRDLGAMLRTMPWIRAVMWSQLPSRSKAHRPGDGVLDWDVQRDPAGAAELARIVREGVG